MTPRLAVLAVAFGLSLSQAACLEAVRYEGPPQLEVQLGAPYASRPLLEISRAQELTVPVVVQQLGGRVDRLTVTIASPPVGISAQPGEISGDASEGTLTLRVGAEAVAGVEYPLPIVVHGGGATAELVARAMVIEPPGTVDRYLPPVAIEDAHPLPFALREGGLGFSGPYHVRLLREDGRWDRSYGRGGRAEYRDEVFGAALRSPELPARAVARLPDGGFLAALPYAALATAESEGLVFFRVGPAGEIDGRAGQLSLHEPPAARATGTLAGVRVPLLGYLPRRLVVDGESLVVLAERPGHPPLVLRLALDGRVLASRVVGAFGSLGPDRAALLLDRQGRLLAAGPTFLARFQRDLTLDESFGQGGLMATGNRPPAVAPSEGGFLAAGSVEQGAKLWLLDEEGAPDASSSPLVPGSFFVRAVQARRETTPPSPAKIFALSSSSHARVMIFRGGGLLDLESADDGETSLMPLVPGDEVLDLIPTTHLRGYVVVRDGSRYLISLVWMGEPVSPIVQPHGASKFLSSHAPTPRRLAAPVDE